MGIDWIHWPLIQRALLAGLLVALPAGYFGAFVVQRGLSFLGNGLAHAAFGGVALALLLGSQPLAIAVPFTVAVAVGIVWVQRHTRLRGDTVIGVFFAVSMALGIVFIYSIKEYTTDPFSYLFGDILAVARADVWAAAGLVGVAALTLPLWGRWAYATFDRDLAQADRLPLAKDDYLLAVCLALTVVVASKVIGIILIAAFLVIPAATARLLARTFGGMTLLAMAAGVASVLVGMWVSLAFNWPSGASIILVQAAGFGVVLAAGKEK